VNVSDDHVDGPKDAVMNGPEHNIDASQRAAFDAASDEQRPLDGTTFDVAEDR
jgi:hypothetical protein